MHIATGGGPAKHEVKTAVVYDASGRVIHTHHVVTLAGGTAMNDDQISARAMELAQDLVAGLRRTITGKLETILVDGRTLRPGITYTVDTERRVLVPGENFTSRRKRRR
jgi:hypothetical protein